MSLSRSVEERTFGLTWVQLSLLVGALIAVAWSYWPSTGGSLNLRVFRDVCLYMAIPGALAVTHGRHLGYRVDRKAIRNTLVLAAFVVPIYVVGSSLPTIRTYYPMWETNAALGNFLPHAVKQFIVVLAAETYYRGFLLRRRAEDRLQERVREPDNLCVSPPWANRPSRSSCRDRPTCCSARWITTVTRFCRPSWPTVSDSMLLDWLVLHDPLIPPETVLHWLAWLPVHL